MYTLLIQYYVQFAYNILFSVMLFLAVKKCGKTMEQGAVEVVEGVMMVIAGHAGKQRTMWVSKLQEHAHWYRLWEWSYCGLCPSMVLS